MLTSSITTNGSEGALDIVPVPHPGEVLNEEFLTPLGITQYRLAKDVFSSKSQISKLVRGRIGLSADMALRLSAYFGNSAEFWLGLQEEYDLWCARRTTDTSGIIAWDKHTA
ncbi:HigA family addiction module antitoxin [Corynebacterium sp. KPL3927]|jgi:addiction module antidote protein HigA|uniref:HigA family addiction module antitoxin n=1 Tax=Corynebacterium sp. KPL3927 TaxID=3158324 RepID=UPI0032EAFDAA